MVLSTKKSVWSILCVLILVSGVYAQDNPYAQKAEALYKIGNYQGALLEYENAINHDSMNYQLWLKQGNIYATLKDWSNASRTLEKVIELKKDYLEGYLTLRKIYIQSQKVDKAIMVLNKAFQHDTDLKRKLGYKIDIISILDQKEELAKAAPHIQEAKQLGTPDADILYYEAKYLNQTGAHQQAIQSAESGLHALNSDNPMQSSRFYYQIGYAYHQLKDYENARPNLVKANYGEYKPLVFKMTDIYHYRIARAYFEAQDYEKSTVFAEITLQMNPNHKKTKELQKQLIKIQEAHQQDIDSLKTLAESQKHPAAKSQTLVKLASLYYTNKNYTEALQTVTEALTLSEDLDAEFLKAVSYYHTGSYEKSAQTILQLMQVKSFRSQEEKAVYFFVMGMAYEKAQNKKEALEQYQKARFGNFKYAVMERMDELEKKM